MDKQELKQRRQALLDAIGEGNIAILPGAKEVGRNADSTYDFRQESGFYYFTGIHEADAVAVFMPGSDPEYVLFTLPKDPMLETWTGIRIGPERAKTEYGADAAFESEEFATQLHDLLKGKQKLFYPLGRESWLDQLVLESLNQFRYRGRSGVLFPTELHNSDLVVNKLRLIKSNAEQQLMRESGEIAANAHTVLMQKCQPGMNEYQLEAEFNYAIGQQGCRHPAYTSIVAGGANACILHYVDNNQELKDGDLVLVDAGAEHQYYASDITRTFPVNGKFSPEQRAVYDVVLQAQLAGIAYVKPGVTWGDIHQEVCLHLTQGLIELGILQGDVAKNVKDKTYFEFFPHNFGHMIGLDVHDPNRYKHEGQWMLMEPGMALTMEPGLYFAPGNSNVDEKWWGIGVRIEDDLLVTADGCEVLTAAVIKDPDQIEELMKDNG